MVAAEKLEMYHTCDECGTQHCLLHGCQDEPYKCLHRHNRRMRSFEDWSPPSFECTRCGSKARIFGSLDFSSPEKRRHSMQRTLRWWYMRYAPATLSTVLIFITMLSFDFISVAYLMFMIKTTWLNGGQLDRESQHIKDRSTWSKLTILVYIIMFIRKILEFPTRSADLPCENRSS